MSLSVLSQYDISVLNLYDAHVKRINSDQPPQAVGGFISSGFLTSNSHKFILIRRLFCFQLVSSLREGPSWEVLVRWSRGWPELAEGITAGYHHPGPSALAATPPSQPQSTFNHLTCIFLIQLSSRNELLLIRARELSSTMLSSASDGYSLPLSTSSLPFKASPRLPPQTTGTKAAAERKSQLLILSRYVRLRLRISFWESGCSEKHHFWAVRGLTRTAKPALVAAVRGRGHGTLASVPQSTTCSV